MNCRHCRKPILIALFGLRHFCSEECKKAHRKAYMANLMKAKRSVSNRGGYIDINSSNVSNTEPHEKPIGEDKNEGHGLSRDNFDSYGGKDWYQLVKKHCCNFEAKQREGHCVTLAEPIERITVPCKDCTLGNILKADVIKNKQGLKGRKNETKEHLPYGLQRISEK
ncbi:MAG: hypothetical protein A2Y81_12480 [Nitrospirae bacterium RBG_13_43_8]|nr:MAG: hypothetical protein A2Y81_12480 [Nitrospirae bacterium RBG_13_43_8]